MIHIRNEMIHIRNEIIQNQIEIVFKFKLKFDQIEIKIEIKEMKSK